MNLEMKKIALTIVGIIAGFTFLQAQSAEEILKKVDQNLSSENRIVESTMTIHGRRRSRTIASRSYTVGNTKSFTEYLSPPRNEGTKMLKLKEQLWIYSPSTDRIIQISGHLIRQSVMGSDLSYEDMMDDRKLTDVYTASLAGKDTLNGRMCYVVSLTAKVEDVAYFSRKMWIDTQRFVPLKEELYAKSGQLLKRILLTDIKQMDGRWYPMSMNFKDMLKQGSGTDFKINKIAFNQQIPAYLFTKAALKE